MGVAILLLAILGHLAFWAAAVNRLHATGMSRRFVRRLTAVFLAAFLVLPVAVGIAIVRAGLHPAEPIPWSAIPNWAIAYFALCEIFAIAVPAAWLWHRVREKGDRYILPESALGGEGCSVQNVPVPFFPDEHTHHYLANLPGNQILQIDLAERVLKVPRLPSCLDGLSIIHLSDLHFTGRVGKAFFREVVAASNEASPDLIAITGDLVDSKACVDWAPELLGQLTARHGVYFVLGNHDRRVDVPRLRRTLVDAGLVDLGGRWVRQEIGGAAIVLAGNELPWFSPAADMSDAPPRGPDGGPLRILLAHSPDQIDWAAAGDFDLMLAGHLHGGQFCLPWIGAILAPSKYGVRFASGVFYRRPTILHVSRGLSGEWPIRFNCAPEVGKIVLRSP